MSKVIHVGLIGLSADTSQGTTWAASAHLPYFLKSPKYEIVALQNSTAEKAQKAIEHYSLPGDVQAYGTPEDLAKDENVDLVVSCIRVDSHASSVIPSILAGKDVYVEWPLEANLAKATELVELAQKHKVRNIIGLQSSFTPLTQQLKSIVQSGRIGRVVSTHNITCDRDAGEYGKATVKYFKDREVGGNPLTIYFGHAVEYMTEVVGPIRTLGSLLSTQFPIIDILDREGNVVEKGVKRTSHDQVLLSGILESGAVFSWNLRGGPTFPGAPIFDWRIKGTKGEIRITSDFFHIFVYRGNMKIEIADFESGKVENLEVDEDAWLDLSGAASNIGRLYEKVWDEKFNGKEREYKNFEDGLKWMRFIDDMYANYDKQHAGDSSGRVGFMIELMGHNR